MFFKSAKLLSTLPRRDVFGKRLEFIYRWSHSLQYHCCTCAYGAYSHDKVSSQNSGSHFKRRDGLDNYEISQKNFLHNGHVLNKQKHKVSFVCHNPISFLSTSHISTSHISTSSRHNSPPSSQTVDVSKDVSTAVLCEGNDVVVSQTSGETFLSAGGQAAGETPVILSTSQQLLLYPDFPIIQGAEASIFYTHLFTGLPWWTSIALTAVVVRLLFLFPITIFQQHNMARLDAQRPKIEALAKKIHAEVADSQRKFYWTQTKAKNEYSRKMKSKIVEMRIRDNCHPLKNFAVLYLQLPVFISVSWALRNICTRATNPAAEYHSEFVTVSQQGTAWFADLTAADPTMILPLMLGAVTLFNIEIHNLNVEVKDWRKYLIYFYRSLALIIVPVCASVPTAMGFYWVSSGLLTAATNLLLNHSRFRRIVKLPKTPYESNQPLRDLLAKAKTKYFKS